MSLTPSTSGSSIGEHQQEEQPTMDELIELLNMEKLNTLGFASMLENTEEFTQLAHHVNELLKGYIKFFEQHPHHVRKLRRF